MTYGEYLEESDTIEVIQDHLRYYCKSSEATLTVSFTDGNAVIASQMLDSVTTHLQQIVTKTRRKRAESALQNAKRDMAIAEQKYHQAQKAYDDFFDSHINANTQEVRQQELTLEKEVTLNYQYFSKLTEQVARQEALKRRAYLSFAVIQDNTVPLKPNNYFIGYLLVFVSFALLITRSIKRYRLLRNTHQLKIDWGDLFSPWAITIAIWATILGLYYLLDTKLNPIPQQFYISLTLWLAFFIPCSLGTYYLTTSHDSNSATPHSFYVNKVFFQFVFVIAMVMTPLYVYRVLQIVTMFGTDDLMNNIRLLALYGEGQGILNYSMVITQSLFVVALWAHPKIPTWQVVALAVGCLLNALAIMEKGSIFFVFISVVFVLFAKRVIKLRSILVLSVVLVLFFYLFNLARAVEDSDYQQEETLLDFFAMYALSPPVAFGELTREVIPQFGVNSFEKIYFFLSRFGFTDIVVKEKLQEFVWVPVLTNVYTCFQPFYMDFGYKGVALIGGCYGILSGWLYRLYRNRNELSCCMYTYAVYALVLQFYQENVFTSMVFIIQFAFFAVLLTQQKLRLVINPVHP
jgi:oligosaccharide repeat unit polymerase